MYNHFKSKLAQGQSGEERLHKLFPAWTRTDGKGADFITEHGWKIELKTESRTTEQTPNLALEVVSSPGRPGALYRAVEDNIDRIVYLYADDKLFMYSPAALLEFVITNKAKYRHVFIPNDTYESEVILVPRSDVEHLQWPI